MTCCSTKSAFLQVFLVSCLYLDIALVFWFCLDDEGMEAVLITEYGRKHAQNRKTTYLDMTQMLCGTVLRACHNADQLGDDIGDVRKSSNLFTMCFLFFVVVLAGSLNIHVQRFPDTTDLSVTLSQIMQYLSEAK